MLPADLNIYLLYRSNILQIECLNACCNTQSCLNLNAYRLQGERAWAATYKHICAGTYPKCSVCARSCIRAGYRTSHVVFANNVCRAEYQPRERGLAGNANIESEFCYDGSISAPN